MGSTRVTLTNSHFCTPLCTRLGVQACTPLAHLGNHVEVSTARHHRLHPECTFGGTAAAASSKSPRNLADQDVAVRHRERPFDILVNQRSPASWTLGYVSIATTRRTATSDSTAALMMRTSPLTPGAAGLVPEPAITNRHADSSPRSSSGSLVHRGHFGCMAVRVTDRATDPCDQNVRIGRTRHGGLSMFLLRLPVEPLDKEISQASQSFACVELQYEPTVNPKSLPANVPSCAPEQSTEGGAGLLGLRE